MCWRCYLAQAAWLFVGIAPIAYFVPRPLLRFMKERSILMKKEE